MRTLTAQSRWLPIGLGLVTVTILAAVLTAGGVSAATGYQASLDSPAPPAATDTYAWSVSGSKPGPGQQISDILLYGCWNSTDIESVTIIDAQGEFPPAQIVIEPHGTPEGSVKLEGVQDYDLPITITIVFSSSSVSSSTGTTIFIKTGGGKNTGFTNYVGGPTCSSTTASPTPTNSPTPTSDVTSSPTSTPAPTLTATPSPTPSPSPTESPTPTDSPTPSPTPTPTDPPAPTEAPTADPTDSVTPAPTDPPTPTPTDPPAPTDAPTADPTDSPTPAPTDPPTPMPTDPPAPTDAPTADPTGSPTPAPTNSPTLTPGDDPASTPTVSPASPRGAASAGIQSTPDTAAGGRQPATPAALPVTGGQPDAAAGRSSLAIGLVGLILVMAATFASMHGRRSEI